MLAYAVRPGVRCRYGVQFAALKSMSRRLDGRNNTLGEPRVRSGLLPLVAFLWNCALPLPVADAGGAQFPQLRHWRAVAKQAREWHLRQGGVQ